MDAPTIRLRRDAATATAVGQLLDYAKIPAVTDDAVIREIATRRQVLARITHHLRHSRVSGRRSLQPDPQFTLPRGASLLDNPFVVPRRGLLGRLKAATACTGHIYAAAA